MGPRVAASLAFLPLVSPPPSMRSLRAPPPLQTVIWERSEPYASAGLGVGAVVTAKSVQSEAASASSPTRI